MINEWKRIIPEKWSDLETEERVGKIFGVRERCLGRWEDIFCQERSGRNETEIALTLYIEIYKSRQIESYREVSRLKIRQIQLSRSYRKVSTTKGAWWIEKLSSIYRAYRNFLNGSSIYQEVIETEINKNKNKIK